MSDNWLRACTLLITAPGGRTLDLSNLRCVFTLQAWEISQWRNAVFKIYNLSDDTANAIQAGEFATIQLIAGYQGHSGILFDGKIRYSSRSLENKTDTVVTIQARDCHDAMVYATINLTMGKGYDAALVDAALMKTYKPFGVTQGMTAKMPDTKFPRSKAFYGHSNDYQTQLGQQCQFNWQFINGQRVSMPDHTYFNNVIVLNSRTGLLGVPTQTIKDGAMIRCLINPNIQWNSLIQVDFQTAREANFNDINFFDAKKPSPDTKGKDAAASATATADTPPNYASALATTGFFVVKSFTCQGDTMGDDWYMDLTCTARNDLVELITNDLSIC
ncbi:hypothetical protein [Sodalis sp. dw_96]|uniref:hypothetical protein n=1 Tax=Sodalis sp. dw_96 TaxID=2719794 RepID=UPI001BD24517|nr:hypothetical protein [Sodalis sp. dw_96]